MRVLPRGGSCTLMTGTRGLNLEDSWVSTSPSSCWCFRTFRIFMIRTMAACAARGETRAPHCYGRPCTPRTTSQEAADLPTGP